MFDLLPMLLSSVVSFLFPIFASYKALKTSDPAQLTPWLMYWVVISCFLLAESWVYFIVSWVPFYGYFRLLFLLYLIMPQTQGARILYEEQVHPFLEENEAQIDELITSAHNRATEAGMEYLKLAIEQFKTKVLGLPPSPEPAPPPQNTPQGYTQNLLSRFSVPAARWAGASNTGSSNTGTDFYSLLSSAVAAVTSTGAPTSGSGSAPAASGSSLSNSATLIPPHLRNSNEKMSFIIAQRDRLNIVLSALEREAQQLRAGGNDDNEATQRPGSGASGLSKSRSEVDFEKIDAESGAEDDSTLRRRNVTGDHEEHRASGSWMPWAWGAPEGSTSSGMER